MLESADLARLPSDRSRKWEIPGQCGEHHQPGLSWSAPTEWSGCNVSGYTVSALEA
jgi:hypothetical protein